MDSTVTIHEAARRLGVSRNKVGAMVRKGVLPALENPLDRRQRRIPLSAIEKIQRTAGETRRVRPRTVGMVSDGSLQSEDVDEYLRANWAPR